MIDDAPRALRGARCMRGRRWDECRDGRAGAVLREDVDGVCGLARAKDDALRCRPCGLHFEGEPLVMRAVAGCGQG